MWMHLVCELGESDLVKCKKAVASACRMRFTRRESSYYGGTYYVWSTLLATKCAYVFTNAKFEDEPIVDEVPLGRNVLLLECDPDPMEEYRVMLRRCAVPVRERTLRRMDQ